MKRNEGPKGQKLENAAGPGAGKFFMWDIAETRHFCQLVGGGPTRQPRQAKNERK